jgi:cell division protein FtsI/penicillin-binding protein 2
MARNAIKGSCNRYFSVVADRLNSVVLQKWLYMFGYGRKVLGEPDFDEMTKGLDRTAGTDRNLSQSAGTIASSVSWPAPANLGQVPSLANFEKRQFGIGQGNLRVTVLQVANAMGTIARGGIYKSPRLFLSKSDPLNMFQTDLGISGKHIKVVRDGMSAVVNERGGTAYKAFADSELIKRQVKVFGKTGSTEKPYHAWFAGFAEDGSGRALSFAIVVEGGASGSGDAAPLAEQMLRLCVRAGYIGHD